MKKTIAVVLCLSLLLTTLAQSAFASESVDLGAIVKSQYEAFSESVNVSRGSFYGTMALLTHATTGKGKDLNVGEGHSVTALLLNSEGYTAGIVAALTKFVESGEDSIYLEGSQNYYTNNFKFNYKLNGKAYASGAPASNNDYDTALRLVGGSVKSYITVTTLESNADEITYNVEILLKDGFDFNGTYEGWEDADLEKALTSLGKFLADTGAFTTYNWSVSADFELTVPNTHYVPEETEPEATEPEATEPPHTHSYNAVVTAPTCTEDGYTTYTCDCGDSYVADEVKAAGHSYEAVVTAPSCTEDGYTTYTCSCGDSYVGDEVKADGHVYNTVVTAPTCTEDGYTTYTCSCGDSYVADEVKAAGHSYEAVVTAPSCTEDGYTTYTCSCGDSYVGDMVKADGHVHSANVIAPTCTKIGYTVYTCDCGDTYVANEVDATGHNYEAVVTAPSCIEAGFTTYTCDCGDSYVADEVKASGHSYKAVVTAPTCTEAGYTTYTCDCGDTYVGDEVSATGHSYEAVVTAPTETEQGYTTYTCACGDSYVSDYTDHIIPEPSIPDPEPSVPENTGGSLLVRIIRWIFSLFR